MFFYTGEVSGIYIALRGQVRLHRHGVFDHQLCFDFGEQVESGDARHQTIRVHAFFFTVWKKKTANR